MADRLDQLINIINKTGDKLIVYDRHEPEKSYVILSIQAYEGLIETSTNVKGLTEDELIDKINQDIAAWKSERVEVSETPDFSNDYGDRELMPSPVWQPPQARSQEAHPKKNAWKIPENRKHGANSTNL